VCFKEYVFLFNTDGSVTRIPAAKWSRVREGDELLQEFSNRSVQIAYAYIKFVNSSPDYCPRIDGVIYYFDENGRVISDKPHYFDLLQDLDEVTGGVINLQHRKLKVKTASKYQWQVNAKQIQLIVDNIWKK